MNKYSNLALFGFLLFILVESNSFAQKMQASLFITTDIPDKAIMPEMQTNIGWGLSFGYRPIFGFPMIAEAKASWGLNASTSKNQDVLFQGNTQSTNIHSTYNSKMNKYLIGAKWLIGYDIKTFRGFVTPQIGLANFKTLVNISYSDDNNRQQTDRQVSHRNLTPVYGGEIGLEILLNNIFPKKINGKEKHRIVLSMNLLRSFGYARYLNVNNMFDISDGHGYTINENSEYLPIKNDYSYSSFYAEKYKTRLQFSGFNIGYIINIGYDEDEEVPQ